MPSRLERAKTEKKWTAVVACHVGLHDVALFNLFRNARFILYWCTVLPFHFLQKQRPIFETCMSDLAHIVTAHNVLYCAVLCCTLPHKLATACDDAYGGLVPPCAPATCSLATSRRCVSARTQFVLNFLILHAFCCPFAQSKHPSVHDFGYSESVRRLSRRQFFLRHDAKMNTYPPHFQCTE